VRDRPNDIGLVAVIDEMDVQFRLHLSLGEREAPRDVGVYVLPEESLLVLAALAKFTAITRCSTAVVVNLALENF
jgi:hypothetical protein